MINAIDKFIHINMDKFYFNSKDRKKTSNTNYYYKKCFKKRIILLFFPYVTENT
jgi:hypothetical protein